jgi:hypothetical protein
MHKSGKKPPEISEVTGIKIRTVYSYLKILETQGEEKVLLQPPKNTRQPPPKLMKLKDYIEENPFAFNKEIAIVLQTHKNNIQRWRHKLSLMRKKAKTTYKEADTELKKSL